jgi:hypothetical protein
VVRALHTALQHLRPLVLLAPPPLVSPLVSSPASLFSQVHGSLCSPTPARAAPGAGDRITIRPTYAPLARPWRPYQRRTQPAGRASGRRLWFYLFHSLPIMSRDMTARNLPPKPTEHARHTLAHAPYCAFVYVYVCISPTPSLAIHTRCMHAYTHTYTRTLIHT